MKSLILAGGESRRMGADKAFLPHYGKNWLARCEAVLKDVGLDIWVCIRSPQQNRLKKENPYLQSRVILDAYCQGPLGGIISFVETFPGVSCLVVPVDMLLIDSDFLKSLLAKRNPAKDATVIKNAQGIIEPLVAIYEPEGLKKLEACFRQGITSVVQSLKNLCWEEIEADPRATSKNLNTPHDFEEFQCYHF